MTAVLRPARAGLHGSPVLVGALAAFAWLVFSIALRPLSLPEEGRYVGVAWEMLRSGDWIVPTEDGLPFFHKPPLFYWLSAASMHLFGVNAWSPRLAPLLAALLGAAGLYRAGRRWAGERVARWTTLVLVTEPFFFAGAQFANLDMLVAVFIALAIVVAGHAALLMRLGQAHRGALIAAWGAMALGVLAKGLIGIALPGLVVIGWLLVTGQRRTILRLLSPAGIAVFALIAAPWFIAAQLRHPGFARFFFVYQHFERFAAGGFNNVQPWWFFVIIVPLLVLPWSLWLLRSTFGTRSGETTEARLWRQLMWTWLAVVLVFFSIPQSKPVGYAMPVLFPLAALAADAIAAHTRQGTARAPWLAPASAALAALICVSAVAYYAIYYKGDNTALAHLLQRLRAPGDPVVFVGEYFFDIPLHARLAEPVPVISQWHDPAIALRDNWKRELAEAAPFAPALAATLLVDAEHGLALRCGKAPLWAIAKTDNVALVAALPGATQVTIGRNQVSLWRVPPGGCDSVDAARSPR